MVQITESAHPRSLSFANQRKVFLGSWKSGRTLARRTPEITLQLDESLTDVRTLPGSPLSPPRILASELRRLRAEDGGVAPHANK